MVVRANEYLSKLSLIETKLRSTMRHNRLDEQLFVEQNLAHRMNIDDGIRQLFERLQD